MKLGRSVLLGIFIGLALVGGVVASESGRVNLEGATVDAETRDTEGRLLKRHYSLAGEPLVELHYFWDDSTGECIRIRALRFGKVIAEADVIDRNVHEFVVDERHFDRSGERTVTYQSKSIFSMSAAGGKKISEEAVSGQKEAELFVTWEPPLAKVEAK